MINLTLTLIFNSHLLNNVLGINMCTYFEYNTDVNIQKVSEGNKH